MRKYLFIQIIICSIYYNVKSQDTIYSYSFPNGIITNEIKTSLTVYKLHPIQNPTCEVAIRKKEMIKICMANGQITKNPEYEPESNIVLLTESATGKIHYEGKIEFKDVSCKDLYNSVKQMSTGIVDYYLIASDDKDYSFLNYKGRFSASFAGDPYDIVFSLNIKFKDGKIKYEYRDFVMIQKTNSEKISASTFWNQTTITTTVNNKAIKSLDIFYCGGNKYSDTKSFWLPIYSSINNSIESITKACNDTKKDW